MFHPQVFFAICVLILSTFLVRPAFSAQAHTGKSLTADCQIKSMDEKTVDSERRFQVAVQDLRTEDVEADSTMLTVTRESISTDARQSHILDLEVFEDSRTQMRTYRSTVYEKIGFRAGRGYRTIGSNEVITQDKSVRLRHFDYKLNKLFDCRLK